MTNLTIIGKAKPRYRKNGKQRPRVKAVCKCGVIKEYDKYEVTSGHTKSCGCLRSENNKTDHPLYVTWESMKARCYNKNKASYKWYGGKGVIVCDEWLNDFWQFVSDMGDKPSPELTLDRIDSNGIYCKDNCRWLDSTGQAINKQIREDNTSGYKGVSYHKRSKKWRAYIHFQGVRYELGSFNYKEEAIEARKLGEQKYW